MAISEIQWDFSIGLAILAVGIIIALILMICRASQTLIIYWMAIYFIVMITMYLGAIGLVVGFLSGVIYFAWAILKIWVSIRV